MSDKAELIVEDRKIQVSNLDKVLYPKVGFTKVQVIDYYIRVIDYCLAQYLPTLVWAANLADLELHTSLARKEDVARPTMMVFDLDPGAPADIVQCCQIGLWLRDLLAKMKLKSFAKTSGSKGLQVYVPLNTAVTFDGTKN